MKTIKNALKNYFEKYGAQITASYMMMSEKRKPEVHKSLSISM